MATGTVYNSHVPGEVDTTAPFESVKEAVSMFGGIADPKALKFPSPEKRASMELQQLRGNLAATKLQLAQAQTAKNSLYEELVETKRLVELKTSELAQALNSKTVGDATHDEEYVSQIEAVSNVVKEKYEAAVATLASTEEEVERLNAEIESSVAAIEANSSLLYTDETDKVEASTTGTQMYQKDIETDKMETFRKELEAAKESEQTLLEEISRLQTELGKVKIEVTQATLSECKAKNAAEAAKQELSELRSKLDKLVEEKDILSQLCESLRDQLAKAKMELAQLKDAEAEMSSASPTTAAELQKLKAELAETIKSEAKARETIAGLTHALQKVTFEADEQRIAAETALEEAHKLRQELDEAKAAAFTAESKLQAANREVQAAKASEHMAVTELKMLTEKDSTVSSPKNEEKMKKENDSLRKRLEETEEVAEMKVAAALAKVDAAKASEREVQTKLEAARAEVESNKSLIKQALHRAEVAEAAKSAIENELRRRRKAAAEGGAGTTTAHRHSAVQTPDRRHDYPVPHTMHRRSLDYSSDTHNYMSSDHHSYVSADVSAESISQLLQLKVSPLKSNAGIPVTTNTEKPHQKQKKNKSFIPKLGSYLSRRRSSVGSTSPR